jgi:hypothetical protein
MTIITTATRIALSKHPKDPAVDAIHVCLSVYATVYDTDEAVIDEIYY